VKSANFEINAPELNDITHSDHLLLVVREKVLENLIDGTFLANDKPHGPLEFHVVFFVFLKIFLLPALVDLVHLHTVPIWNLCEVLLVQLRPVERPKRPV
jgi:hypothetical protein